MDNQRIHQKTPQCWLNCSASIYSILVASSNGCRRLHSARSVVKTSEITKLMRNTTNLTNHVFRRSRQLQQQPHWWGTCLQLQFKEPNSPWCKHSSTIIHSNQKIFLTLRMINMMTETIWMSMALIQMVMVSESKSD